MSNTEQELNLIRCHSALSGVVIGAFCVGAPATLYYDIAGRAGAADAANIGVSAMCITAAAALFGSVILKRRLSALDRKSGPQDSFHL